VEYHVHYQDEPAVLTVPLQAFADAAGRDAPLVQFTAVGPGKVRARWLDLGVPQVREYDVPETAPPPFPTAPEAWTDPGPDFLRALGDAADTTSPHDVRYALSRLQLRGKAGEIAASDGRQLLLRRGFRFPFGETLLVPALEAFTGKEPPDAGEVRLGATDMHVAVRVGPWTFFLPIDRTARYPDVDAVVPKAGKQDTTVRLAPEDAAFLLRALPRLPCEPDSQDRITIDLNGHVAVRARSDPAEPPTEVVLERSTTMGPPVRFATDRAYLARALKLGFRDFRVAGTEAPVLCRDEHRLFLWMTLGKEGALPPGGDVVPVRADSRESSPSVELPPRKPMTQPPNDGPPVRPGMPQRNGAPADDADELLTEAEALRTLLHEAAGRANRLTLALKQQLRQSKALRAALASLRGLDARL
jgi:hypothetical protein